MKAINYKYMTKQELVWKKLELTCEEYFDELEPDEEGYDIDSSPRYDQFYKHLDIPLDQLLFIHLVVRINKKKIEYKQTFWNNGANSLTEIKEKGYHGLIIASQVNKREDETIRVIYGRDRLYPVLHSFIKEEPHNKWSERRVDVGVYIDLCKKNKLMISI